MEFEIVCAQIANKRAGRVKVIPHFGQLLPGEYTLTVYENIVDEAKLRAMIEALQELECKIQDGIGAF